MTTLRALIVGVSDYSLIKQNDLPFCVNDIYAIKTAFSKGLNVDDANIFVCSNTGVVTAHEFTSALQRLVHAVKIDDTLLFYFSGHGCSLPDGHYLLFSDSYIKTEDIISQLDGISSKSKIIFLDCCMAGNFAISETPVFNINDTADEFAGKGYAVIASSTASQYSYGHPTKPVSLFTSFLCESLMDTHIIKEGTTLQYRT